MHGELITVSRFLSRTEMASQVRSGKFLSLLRNMVKDVRARNPQLAGYRLFDVGLVNRGRRIEVRLYFRG